MKTFVALLICLACAPTYGSVCTRSRGGHQVSPSWAYAHGPAVAHADGTWTGTLPSADTDAARGVALVTAVGQTLDGLPTTSGDVVYLGPRTYDVVSSAGTGIYLEPGVSLDGSGPQTIVTSSNAACETIDVAVGTTAISNMRVQAPHASGKEPIVLKGTSGTCTISNVTCDASGLTTDASFWMNADSSTAICTNCVFNGVQLNGGSFQATNCTIRGNTGGTKCITRASGGTGHTLTNCTLNFTPAANQSLFDWAATSGGTATSFTITGCTMTMGGTGTGSVIKYDGGITTATANVYNTVIVTSATAANAILVANNVKTLNVFGCTVSGGNGTTGFDLKRTAGTLNYNSQTYQGYAPTTFANSSGTITNVTP